MPSESWRGASDGTLPLLVVVVGAVVVAAVVIEVMLTVLVMLVVPVGQLEDNFSKNVVNVE